MYEDAKAGKLLATENEEESSEAAETSKPDSDEKTTKEEEKKGDKTATGTVTHSCTYVNIELKLNRHASTIRSLHILYCRILSYDVMIIAFCVKVYIAAKLINIVVIQCTCILGCVSVCESFRLFLVSVISQSQLVRRLLQQQQ